MGELSLLKDKLEKFQDMENQKAGKHVIIPLTVSILAELIKTSEGVK